VWLIYYFVGGKYSSSDCCNCLKCSVMSHLTLSDTALPESLRYSFILSKQTNKFISLYTLAETFNFQLPRCHFGLSCEHGYAAALCWQFELVCSTSWQHQLKHSDQDHNMIQRKKISMQNQFHYKCWFCRKF